MKPITITLGGRTYHPVPVGKDGLFEWERKKLKRMNKSVSVKWGAMVKIKVSNEMYQSETLLK
jgi:hypothetical protein